MTGLTSMLVAGVSLLVVLLIMGAELALSRRHEHSLRAQGALEPPGDVYRTMRWADPAAFVAMAVEGAFLGPAPGSTTVAGAGLLAAAKLLKGWAVSALGSRWTFRVLVPPSAPLVTRGPYAWMRHPNYVAVIGELVGMAVLVGARVTGPLGVLLFSLLLRARIRVENRALRHPTCS